MESGKSIPKGYTLQALAEAFGIDKSELVRQIPIAQTLNDEDDLRLRFMNLSAFCFMGIPFGNILIPFLIWNKNRSNTILNEVGKKILSFQILWTLSTCVLLIMSPFLQDLIVSEVTLILSVGLVAVIINAVYILYSAYLITRQEYAIPLLENSLNIGLSPYCRSVVASVKGICIHL